MFWEAYRFSWGPRLINIQTAAATRGLPPPSSSGGALAMNLQGVNRGSSQPTGVYSWPPQCKLLGCVYVV